MFSRGCDIYRLFAQPHFASLGGAAQPIACRIGTPFDWLEAKLLGCENSTAAPINILEIASGLDLFPGSARRHSVTITLQLGSSEHFRS